MSNPPVNFVTRQAFDSLARGFDALLADENCTAIVITAEHQEYKGRTYFSAGADLKLLAELANGSAEDARAFFDFLMTLGLKIENSPKPVVSDVRGVCYGYGLELVLCSDHLILLDESVLASPEVKHGIMPGAGATQRLLRWLRPERAVRMVLTGEEIFGVQFCAESRYYGGNDHDIESFMHLILADPKAYVEKECAPVLLPPLSSEGLEKLGKGLSRSAVMAAYFAMAKGAPLLIEQALEVEKQCFLEQFHSPDGREGLRAFVEKRKPNFSDVM